MTKEVEYIVSIFNKVFSDLGQNTLLENKLFIIGELPADFYLKFKSVESSNRLKISFEISNSGVTFWIDRTAEIPDWSLENIRNDPKSFETELKNIFSKTIVIKRKGNKTTINLLNDKGGIVRTYTFHLGLLGVLFNCFYKTQVCSYQPIFPPIQEKE